MIINYPDTANLSYIQSTITDPSILLQNVGVLFQLETDFVIIFIYFYYLLIF